MIATHNKAKASQINTLLAGLPFRVSDGSSIAAQPAILESGLSHLANAIEKATVWSREFRCIAIGSDGGLSIPALGTNWSSLITRRGTGEDVSDKERAARLLRRMAHLSGPGRSCHWTESLAVARQGVPLGAWEVNGLHGEISEEYVPPPDGSNGFWVSGLWTTRSGIRHWELTVSERAELGDPWAELTPLIRDLLIKLRDLNHASSSDDEPISRQANY